MAAHTPRDVVIVDAVRTPIGRRGGGLSSLHPATALAAVQSALDDVREAAGSTDNLVPPVMAAVRAMATVGEITRALKEVFGGYQEAIRF